MLIPGSCLVCVLPASYLRKRLCSPDSPSPPSPTQGSEFEMLTPQGTLINGRSYQPEGSWDARDGGVAGMGSPGLALAMWNCFFIKV